MNRPWTYLLILILLSSCSVLNNERMYQGSYNNETITVHFENSKEGILVLNENDSIPFKYKIEKNKTNPQTKKIDDELEFYVYRFTLNAGYELSFPLGFYEIGQKGGAILNGNNGMTLVRVKN